MNRYVMIGGIILVGGIGLWMGTRGTPPAPPELIQAPEVPEIAAPEPVAEPPVEEAPIEEPAVEEPVLEVPPTEETPAEDAPVEEAPLNQAPAEEAPATTEEPASQSETDLTDPSALPDATPSMTDESAIPEATAPDSAGDGIADDLSGDSTGLDTLSTDPDDPDMPAGMDQDTLRTMIEGADGLSTMQRNSLLLLLESAGENRALLEEVYRSAMELRGN